MNQKRCEMCTSFINLDDEVLEDDPYAEEEREYALDTTLCGACAPPKRIPRSQILDLDNTQETTMTRTITLEIEQADLDHCAKITGIDKLWGAIGRLSTWGLQHSSVNIFLNVDRDGGIDIRAAYRDAPGFDEPVKFFIAAVWHPEGGLAGANGPEGAFGFHS